MGGLLLDTSLIISIKLTVDQSHWLTALQGSLCGDNLTSLTVPFYKANLLDEEK